jgi:hypothetical protein
MNKYVKLVEAKGRKFSDIVSELAAKFLREKMEGQEVERLAKDLAYVSAWNGVGHTITDTKLKERFGIKYGVPTKVESYNKAKENFSKVLDSGEIEKIILATEKSKEYMDEYVKHIQELVNGKNTVRSLKHGNLLDLEQQPEMIKKLKQTIYDYYLHYGV